MTLVGGKKFDEILSRKKNMWKEEFLGSDQGGSPISAEQIEAEAVMGEGEGTSSQGRGRGRAPPRRLRREAPRRPLGMMHPGVVTVAARSRLILEMMTLTTRIRLHLRKGNLVIHRQKVSRLKLRLCPMLLSSHRIRWRGGLRRSFQFLHQGGRHFLMPHLIWT
jgi:hypothetical protein